MPLTTDSPTRSGPARLVLHAQLVEQAGRLHEAAAAVRAEESEGLHDLRVAMRRLRTALATFRPLVDRSVTDPLRDELGWAARELGQARDGEVVARRIRELVSAEPVELVQGPVAARLQMAIHRSERAGDEVVARTLASARYAAVLDRLDALVAGPPWSEQAERPAGQFARKRIHQDLERLLELGRAAYGLDDVDERATALHELRKAAKRLRYAAEASRSVTGRKVKRIGKSGKKIQQFLGHHHDSVATREALRRLAAEANEAGETTFTYGRLHALEQARATEFEKKARKVLDRLQPRPPSSVRVP